MQFFLKSTSAPAELPKKNLETQKNSGNPKREPRESVAFDVVEEIVEVKTYFQRWISKTWASTTTQGVRFKH